MERARALPSCAQSCRSSFPFVRERASFAAGFAQQRKKYSESPLAPPNRTAPTSPSFCSTRATSCTASSAARRRTTTPGSSTSWTRVSFFFFLFCFLRGRGSNDSSLWLIFENCNNSKTGYPGSERFFLHYADLIDFGSLCQLLR